MNSYLVGLKSKDGGLCIILHLLPYCKNASNETVLLSSEKKSLTLYLIETPLNTFVNRSNPDQAALIRATLFAYGNIIRYDTTLVDLTSNFFVLHTSMKVYIYNYNVFIVGGA